MGGAAPALLLLLLLPPPPRPHSPSHTVRCWHGENSTSSASSEHTRHSAASGPAGTAACRLDVVLGVLSTSLGSGAATLPACRSLQVEEGGLTGPLGCRPCHAHHARTGSPEALGTALEGGENSALRSQVQRGAATVVGVVHIRALQRQEASDRGAHRQFCAGREARGLQLGAEAIRLADLRGSTSCPMQGRREVAGKAPEGRGKC